MGIESSESRMCLSKKRRQGELSLSGMRREEWKIAEQAPEALHKDDVIVPYCKITMMEGSYYGAQA